jgi:exonuclease-1
MVNNICIALKQENIAFIVAAYEADAQLAYLSRVNMVDVVLTVDSDTLVYGCKRVLFKLDRNGYVDEIKRNDLGIYYYFLSTTIIMTTISIGK